MGVQWAYLAASVAALDYFHDAWFYWTHRALHSRWLFRHVHYLHHRCAAACAGRARHLIRQWCIHSYDTASHRRGGARCLCEAVSYLLLSREALRRSALAHLVTQSFCNDVSTARGAYACDAPPILLSKPVSVM